VTYLLQVFARHSPPWALYLRPDAVVQDAPGLARHSQYRFFDFIFPVFRLKQELLPAAFFAAGFLLPFFFAIWFSLVCCAEAHG